MNRFLWLFFICALFSCKYENNERKMSAVPVAYKISPSRMMDKIKGGWAGQTIGCTYGGPTEFKFNGTMIQQYIPVNWNDSIISWYYKYAPGLYDDVYMDLTFLDMIHKYGLNVPVDSLALSFARAEYPLWHANQAARYNILHGIMPPASGHWLNNPHADDLDFQIEADFAGLITPGMPNTAAAISDEVGHIMNYGDGLYGGVYIGAMYSLAFIFDDIESVVQEALKCIPEKSNYYKCISDVIAWYEKYPDDWRRTWFECEKKWSSDIGCPDGVFVPFNIDAALNSAYIVIGLLYGRADFHKTMDIAMRCGQDSDCNPASAAGILGTMIGYDSIPESWKKSLRQVEGWDFAYTNISLNKAYQMNYDLALDVIRQEGGRITNEEIEIRCQQPQPVKYEKSFENIYPVELRSFHQEIAKMGKLTFEGNGFVLKGYVQSADPEYTAKLALVVDGVVEEEASLPADFKTRRHELFWNYRLKPGNHIIEVQWLNPEKEASVVSTGLLIYKNEQDVSSASEMK